MFGYACNDTPELMPLPIALAHRIIERTDRRPADAATSIGCGPTARARSRSNTTAIAPVRIDTVVVSTQHGPKVSQDEIRDFVIEQDRQAAAAAAIWSTARSPITSIRRAASRSAAARRLRADRTEDHRRYLRRLGPPRRRSVQRQGSRPRSIAAPPTWPVTWPRTSSPPAWPIAAKCNWPTPSASPIRSACCRYGRHGQGSTTRGSASWCANCSR